METKIKIIDACMGKGKTTQICVHMKKESDVRYLYITPFLHEVDRILDTMGGSFQTPKNFGDGKVEGLKRLVQRGYNIAATHALFVILDEEAEQMLEEAGYILVMDETLDVIQSYNNIKGAKEKPIGQGDIDYISDNDGIEVDEYGRVHWIEQKEYKDFHYEEMRRHAQQGALVCLNQEILLWELPPRIFSRFSEVYVLTYLFNGSVLRHYFEGHGMNYEMLSLRDGEIVPYYSDKEERAIFKELIVVLDDQKLNSIGNNRGSLSKNWYDHNHKRFKDLKRNLNTLIKRMGIKSEQIMWTTYKANRKAIEGKGYTYTKKNLTARERALPDSDKEKKALNCFVSCSCRATNDYGERTFLMYLINRFYNPEVKKYFLKLGVTFDEDAFALAEMLQWIWRSAIRNGKPITIYIPSKRMRKLLLDWLDGKD